MIENPDRKIPEADLDTAGDSLWFLPGPVADEEQEISRSPLPAASRRTLLDIGAWRAAEAGLVRELGDLALNTGRLLERVQGMGPGAGERLAHAEAAAIGWWTGHRITQDRIALFLAWRLGATGEDAEALIRVTWAARRLMAPRAHGREPAAGIVAHLALESDAARALAEDVVAVLPGPDELGPVARACAAFHLWQVLDERPISVRGIEAAVLGARLGLGIDGQLPGFLPLSLSGMGALAASGNVAQRLALWVSGAGNAVLAALMMLERLRQWQDRAQAAIADQQGRTPGRLIASLARQPMLSVPQLVGDTGASRPAVDRNLALLARRGLIREVTGQGRFRIWAARL